MSTLKHSARGLSCFRKAKKSGGIGNIRDGINTTEVAVLMSKGASDNPAIISYAHVSRFMNCKFFMVF